MDHHPGARNLMRPDLHPAAVQQPHHHHHNHFHSSPLHQHPMVGGNPMGGVVVDRDYVVDGQMFRAPTMGGPEGMPSHPYVTSTGEPNVAPDSSPPSNSSYGDMGGKSFGRKRSRKRPKTCGVCGDRAKSFHFGGLSCDSCKAFFRRSVQNDAHVAFRCAYDSCCDINISTRKSCQFCRFKKCLSIGMEKSWVMTEEERNALNQQRLEKKQQQKQPNTNTNAVVAPPTAPINVVDSPPQQLQQLPRLSPGSSSTSSSIAQDPIYTFQAMGKAGATTIEREREPAALAIQDSNYVPEVDKMLEYMTSDEQQEIKMVVETYLHAYKEMPFRVSFEEGRRDTLEIIEMFTTILRRFAYFAKLIPDFASLDRDDQGNLLRAAVLEMCLLRGAACFDTENNRWPSSTMESLKDCPQLRVEDMQRLVSRELFDMHITFILHMKRLRIDEPIAMLLIMTVLFSPERIPVENKVRVNQSQEKYLMLLKKYVIWKFGEAAGSRVYPQLLTKLSDLRQLNDFHTEFHLNLDSKEVNAIKKSLEELHLNPYPNWNIVPESQALLQQDVRGEQSDTSASATPSPASSASAMSMPMMTQALIQSFADRRIPTLLDNPYATFETDLSMIRQVQQTLGSLFPASAAAALFANAQQRQQGSDSDISGGGGTRIPDSLLAMARSDERPSSLSPRENSSSTDSAEVQVIESLQSSFPQGYHSPGAGDSSSSSAPMEGSYSGEYHADRFHQFLSSQNGRSRSEIASVIKELASPMGFAGAINSNSGSQQTVLRKHSSGGSSLPGTPWSVIRTAPPRQAESSSRGILQHGSSMDAPPEENYVSGAGKGWNGGEIQTPNTTNGYHQVSGTPTFTISNSAQPQTWRSNDNESLSEDED